MLSALGRAGWPSREGSLSGRGRDLGGGRQRSGKASGTTAPDVQLSAEQRASLLTQAVYLTGTIAGSRSLPQTTGGLGWAQPESPTGEPETGRTWPRPSLPQMSQGGCSWATRSEPLRVLSPRLSRVSKPDSTSGRSGVCRLRRDRRTTPRRVGKATGGHDGGTAGG